MIQNLNTNLPKIAPETKTGENINRVSKIENGIEKGTENYIDQRLMYVI